MQVSSFTTHLCDLLLLSSFTEAVIAGQQAGLLAPRFIVSVQRSGLLGDSHVCAGAIIAPRKVLTTASCGNGLNPSAAKIRHGSKSITSGGALILVEKILNHPEFNANTQIVDICILTVVSSFNLLIGPSTTALLPAAKVSITKIVPVQVAGWGVTRPSATSLATSLQITQMQDVSREKCAKKWTDQRPITSGMICTVPTIAGNQSTSICAGDQGDPLVDSTGITVLGLASFFDDSCSAFPKPNVFANVLEHAIFNRANMV